LAFQKQQPPQARLSRLLKHYQAGQYVDAEKLAISITKQFPDHQFSWKVLGAALNHAGKFQESLVANQKAVALNPNDAEANIVLGSTLQELGRPEEAEAIYKRAIALQPGFAAAHYCLGITLQSLGRPEDAEVSYRNSITFNPHFLEAYVNLGNTLRNLGRAEEAEAIFRKAIVLKPDCAEAHFALGATLQEFGRLEDAEGSYREAITLKPGYSEAYCSLGGVLNGLNRLEDAKVSYTKALDVKPGYAAALWSLSGTAQSITEAQSWIDQCLAVDENHEYARLTKAALQFYQGDKGEFERLMQTDIRNHFLMRSFAWVFSLPKLPSIYFHRWAFFDAVIDQSIRTRPFYEFGVWRGVSFRYFIKAFKTGFGFDTFTGLPEDWHVGKGKYEKAGAYSSEGQIPKIEGGEFIAGKFEDTLPTFFSEPRPLASVINFDADLYSSTICALNYSKSAIDKHTVLIFDEMIAHECWEQDEFRALNDFVVQNNCTYEVLAVSFATKQVAVKLTGV
jgi:tetratricopeptide (TPR) repeat protein